MEKELKNIKNKLIEQYDPYAIGIFGSSTKKIETGKDIDLYVLNEDFYRDVIFGKKNIYEIYFGEPKTLEKAIEMKNVEIIDRFRKSKVIYDPQKIYSNLIEKAKNQNLAKEGWREETIIGGKYDLVERTKKHVDRCLKDGQLESAVSSLQFLTNRVIELGFRRKNESGFANPKKIPELVYKHFPKDMNDLYKEIVFLDILDTKRIKEIMNYFDKNKFNLLPKK